MTTALTTSAEGELGRLARQLMAIEHCLLVVRHGETELNAEDRLATHTDVALTPKGRRQAEQLSSALAGAAFLRAFSSPLERAASTAEAALRNAHVAGELVLDRRLVEPSAGPFERMRFV